MDNGLTHYEAALLAEFIGSNIAAFTAYCGKHADISNSAAMADNIVNKLADIADEGNK